MDQVLISNDNVPFDLNPVLSSLSTTQNIWIDRWAFIDFSTGTIHYKGNGTSASYRPTEGQSATSDFDIRTASAPNFKVLGTSGLDSCTGLVIVSQTCAIIAHFSAGSLSTTFGGSRSETAMATAFHRFLLDRRHVFRGTTLAFIFRASRIVHRMGSHQQRDASTGETVTKWAFVPIDVRMDQHDTTGVFDDIVVLNSILTGCGLPNQNIRDVTECHPYAGSNGPGHAWLLVDGRASPATFPRVYAKFYGGHVPL